MHLSTRVRVFLTLLSILKLSAGDRLTLSEGGYARVLGPQPTPIGSFTLSAWVNVTKFPEGIAPVLTYFNNDINSQLAFFLREDGVGVLWGGPIFKDGDIANTVRRPRLLWSQLKDSQNNANRRKREAIDYSGGLGDIENIFHNRLGKATDSWVPINFVDVGAMGVDDLAVSGSEQHLSGVDRSSRAHAYSDWTNVPYELHMAESGVDEDYEDTRQVAESQIITQPSGDADDFVYFNWNNPSGAQRQVPLGSNSWSPVWEPTKKSAVAPEIQNKSYQNVYKGPTAQASNVDETTNVHRQPPTINRAQAIDVSNSWNPVNKNYESPPPRPLKTKLLPNKLERPIWPSQSNLPLENLPVQVLSTKTEYPNDLENNIKFKSNDVQPTIPRREFFTVPKSSTTEATTTKPPVTTMITTTTSPISTPSTIIVTKKSAIPQSSSLPPRRNIIPTLYRYTIDRNKKPVAITTPKVEAITKPTQPPKSRTRVPLWKLIKKPTKSDEQIYAEREHKEEILSSSASENIKQIYNFPSYEKPLATTDRIPNIPTFIKPQFPEPTLPPIRIPDNFDNIEASASNTRNVYRSRPVHSPSRRTLTTISAVPTTTTTTELPIVTTRKTFYKPTPITHKVPNYQSSKIEESNPDVKLTSWNKNYKATESKQPYKNTFKHHSHTNEFEKTMQDPEMIREGNRAVVYAVPITNEKEFYDMYKKYQDQSSKTTEVKLNLHDLYNDMRTGNIISKFPDYDSKISKIKENSHTLNLNKQNPVSNVIVEAEVDTDKILKEANRIEAVTPSRSDIPIDDMKTQPQETQEEDRNKGEGSELNDSEIFYEYENENPENEAQYYEYEVNDENQPKPDQSEIQNETISQNFNQNEVTVEPENNIETNADLYKPDILATTNAEKIQPSYFQEPVKLYHEQLPPQYEKPLKQYDFDIPSQRVPQPVEDVIQPYSNRNILLEEKNVFQSPELNPSNGGQEALKWDATNPDLQIPILPQHLPMNPFIKSDLPIISGSQGESQYSEQKPLEVLPFPHNLPQSNPEFNSELSEVEIEPSEEEEANLDIHFEKAPYTFRENGWYHLAYTWNALTKMLRIYVNGEKVADISNVMADKPHMKEGGIFLLGKTLLPDLSDFDTSSQFEGEMSDVNLWATELDPNAVDSLFQCQLEPKSSQSLDWETTQMNLYDDAFMVPSLPFCGLVS